MRAGLGVGTCEAVEEATSAAECPKSHDSCAQADEPRCDRRWNNEESLQDKVDEVLAEMRMKPTVKWSALLFTNKEAAKVQQGQTSNKYKKAKGPSS